MYINNGILEIDVSIIDIYTQSDIHGNLYATTNKIMAILFSMGCIEEGDDVQRVMMPEYGDKMLFKNCHPNYNGKGYLYYLEKSKFVHAMGSQWVCFDEIVPDFIEEIDINDYLDYCIIEK